MAGLTPSGLITKRLDDVRRDLLQRFRGEFGDDIRSDDKSIFGILTGVLARPIADVWAGLQSLYDAFNPDAATGQALDNLASIVGVFREPATYATIQLNLTGDPNVVVPAGSIVRSSQGNEYLASDNVNLGAMGEALGWFVAAEVGLRVEPQASMAIVTPIAGWGAAFNPANVSSGRNVESDEELRLRRAASLGIIGAATDQAIKARLQQLAPVSEAMVISNRTMDVVDGIPPKAFESVIWPEGGSPPLNTQEEEQIAEVIWRTMPAGIQPYGDVIHDVTDQSGTTQQVGFSYATELEVFIAIDVVTTSNYAGDAEVQRVALEAGESIARLGEPVYTADFLCQLVHVPGVRGVNILLGDVNPPTEPIVLSIGRREFPAFDLSRIAVTSNPI